MTWVSSKRLQWHDPDPWVARLLGTTGGLDRMALRGRLDQALRQPQVMQIARRIVAKEAALPVWQLDDGQVLDALAVWLAGVAEWGEPSGGGSGAPGPGEPRTPEPPGENTGHRTIDDYERRLVIPSDAVAVKPHTAYSGRYRPI